MKLGMSAFPVQVRPVRENDVGELARLCVEHAQYERVEIGAGPSEQALCDALFAATPRLYAWCAADEVDRLVGFVSATLDYSTWRAGAFLHMDCLFVRERARGAGVGRALVDALRAHARALRIPQIQWQTPTWNVNAQRFYARLGATRQDKARFMLDVS